LNFYKHHLGDYASDTLHLSWDEDCAYRRLLDAYYKREAPIPAEIRDACRLVRASTPAQRKAVEAVLREFFTLSDDGWHQKRCDAELAQATAQAETNRRIAEEREARKRARVANESSTSASNDPSTNRAPAPSTNRSPDTIGEREPSQTPDSTSQTPDSTTSEKKKTARASRLPTDWAPGEPGLAFAAKAGLSNGRVQAEVEKFRDWWTAQPGQKGVKLDWQATWRTWVRTSLERQPKAPEELGSLFRRGGAE
jgi:uncharacterized protein YdaU (DUF1376 family)